MAGITFLRPTLEPASDVFPLAPRLGSLDGKVIGSFWNNRPHADLILKRVFDVLKERWDIKEVVERKKTFINSAAPLELLQELAEKCDAVVLAVGD